MHLNFNLENLRRNYDNIENYGGYLEAIRPIYLKIVDTSIINSGIQKEKLLFEIKNTEKNLEIILKHFVKNATTEKQFLKVFINYEKLISDYANYQRNLKKNDLIKITDLKGMLLKRDKLYEQYMNK